MLYKVIFGLGTDSLLQAALDLQLELEDAALKLMVLKQQFIEGKWHELRVKTYINMAEPIHSNGLRLTGFVFFLLHLQH